MNKTLSNWFNKYLSDPEAITLIAILILVIAAFKFFGSVLTPVAAAIIIAYLLSGLVGKLQKFHCHPLLCLHFFWEY